MADFAGAVSSALPPFHAATMLWKSPVPNNAPPERCSGGAAVFPVPPRHASVMFLREKPCHPHRTDEVNLHQGMHELSSFRAVERGPPPVRNGREAWSPLPDDAPLAPRARGVSYLDGSTSPYSSPLSSSSQSRPPQRWPAGGVRKYFRIDPRKVRHPPCGLKALASA